MTFTTLVSWNRTQQENILLMSWSLVEAVGAGLDAVTLFGTRTSSRRCHHLLQPTQGACLFSVTTYDSFQLLYYHASVNLYKHSVCDS